jgi:hypothetical protein
MKKEQRYGDFAREFKNGNISVHAEQRSLAALHERGEVLDPNAALGALLCAVEDLDVQLVGDPWCAGNSEMAYTLYNAHRDLAYTVLGSDVSSFSRTGRLRLIAHKPNEAEREDIDQFM